MISVHRITLDCANVPAVAHFWYETLGGRIGPGASSDVAVPTDGLAMVAALAAPTRRRFTISIAESAK